jgi:hypothetical protein
MLKNFIWAYINDRYENDGVLPDADEVYEKFKLEFEFGGKQEWIHSTLESFKRTHDLTGITIL